MTLTGNKYSLFADPIETYSRPKIASAPDGEYSISIDAKNVLGESVTAKTQISGVVDGVDFTSSIPMLKIGSITVPIDKVKSVVRSE